MTRNEAIEKYVIPAIERTWNEKNCKKILEALERESCEDAISRQAAIEELRGRDPSQIWDTADVEVWINSLPSAQPEQTDCEYCHEDSDGYVKPIEKNCHAFICFGMDGWELSLKANGWHGSAKIKYCPMCGRRLKR